MLKEFAVFFSGFRKQNGQTMLTMYLHEQNRLGQASRLLSLCVLTVAQRYKSSGLTYEPS